MQLRKVVSKPDSCLPYSAEMLCMISCMIRSRAGAGSFTLRNLMKEGKKEGM